MVLGRIKKMFSNTKKNLFGDLHCGRTILMNGCEALASQEDLLFSSKKSKMSFKLCEIVSIEHDNKTLSFIHNQKKYLFTSGESLDLFCKAIVPFIKKTKILYKKSAVYSRYNTTTGRFEEASGNVDVFIVEDGMFLIRIETRDDIIHFEEIRTETQYYMDQKNITFVWSVMEGGVFHTFSLKFLDNLDFLEFLGKYIGCLYKNVNHENKEDKEAEQYFEKMEMENYHPDESSESEEEEEYESCDDDELENHFGEADEKNKHLVVGDEMAFITRGKSIGVFENTDDGLEFRANIKNVLNEDVKKIITHDNCASLIYLDKSERDKLHKLDVERGEVIETWDVQRDVNDYFDAQKLIDTGSLVGLSDYSVFRIDPRTKNKVVESKDYKTRNNFNCGMATSLGHVVAAGKGGDLRLYDKIDKRAKSLLPGFGDEIKYIDVTSNGKHIICTCKNYLMLTTVPGDYKQPIGKDKPVPKRLQLKPEHLAYINEEIDFTPAKFSTDTSESSIITSTGSYVVKWNLDDVLNGKLYSYQLAKCNDLVVADNFEFGENNSVIVTMPDDIRKVNVRNLKRPGRKIWG
ncbi:vacuolar import and degradation protein [Encephalitozoon intestinalis ATCC 50506]|uniref:Vacuolar import and degradation protein n=1 Tax=Encephalitozoon intestinalis (strain ATCC 50506) TaxID=876142 RepID=E0S944_ENCIT|nr:vacuolar import and degradation protein [Encephalitozoon intestinalis ATCC 50506]ADM12300.1 vacuolar import and degradation protein [Encephalitozoon intestinalis ATCC 50506]UTX46111.1 VID27 C-terminal WD40-like domain-containing protein [Encephalitozoon intestinalis]